MNEVQHKSRRQAALHVMDLAATILAGTFKAGPGNGRAQRLIKEELERARELYRKVAPKRKELAEQATDLRLEVAGLKQADATGPSALQAIIKELSSKLKALTGDLQSGAISASEWEAEFEVLLARYHTAGLLAGQGSEVLTPKAASYMARLVGSQFEYLGNFAIEIQDAAEFLPGFIARAESYAAAVKVPFWAGSTQMLPLPAMPAEGTQCLNNCGCEWVIEELEGEGNYDAYWVRGKEDSCQTCLEREAQWSPVEIRNWELTLGEEISE